MSKAPEILYTCDLDQFKKHISNRKIVLFVLRRLVESMSKRGFLPTQPITVNSNMEVISGQHRLVAAKQVECGVYYIIDMTVTATDMIDYESASSSWKTSDFIEAQASMGSVDVCRLKETIEKMETNFAIVKACGFPKMVGGSHAYMDDIRTGRLSFTEEDAAWVEKIIGRQKDFIIRSNEDWLTKAAKFVHALAWCSRLPDYDHRRMVEKYQRQQYKLIRCSTMSQYLEILHSIYNYQTVRNFVELRGSKHK